MDISSLISSVTSADSVAGLSQAAGSSAKNVQSVLTAALPGLLGGASASGDGKTESGGILGSVLGLFK